MNEFKKKFKEKIETNKKINQKKRKPLSKFFKITTSALVVFCAFASIVTFSLLGFSFSFGGSEKTYDIYSSNGEAKNEFVLKEDKANQQKNLNLIFEDMTYSFNENYAENIQKIVTDLYIPSQNATVEFNPNEEEIFVFEEEKIGREVDVRSLIDNIQYNFTNNVDAPIIVPMKEIAPEIEKSTLEGLIAPRSQFTTSIASSNANRKHNVKYALSLFNGLVVEPEEIVSFNSVLQERGSVANFKDANVIIGGEYVLARGGGVCQASTTLYNALIRSDISILEVHNHSLPVSYVPLAFDAMVSDGAYDLVFQNTTSHPLYFLATGNESEVSVKIFGEPLEEGLEIKTRTEQIKILPHKGDKIVVDSEHKFSDKITFKGEYLRAKYPKAGSENKGYLQYFKDGKLVEEKEIRHVYYPAQQGVIYEGTEDVFEGIELPENEVRFINPQV